MLSNGKQATIAPPRCVARIGEILLPETERYKKVLITTKNPGKRVILTCYTDKRTEEKSGDEN